MAGRKTIMVDGGVWNKVEELKHNAYLRSSSDAIETAVDIVSSDKYYAGIKAQKDGFGCIAHVVESLGKTEDEAIRNLLIFEQDSVLGDLRAEDIPPADETDIYKEGFFVIECTWRLYHAGKLFSDPAGWKNSFHSYVGGNCLFTCVISESKNGSLIADSEETGFQRYFALVQLMDDDKTVRIVKIGTSPIELHDEILLTISGDPDGLYWNYNACRYQIYPCTPRLFAECIGKIFQSREDIEEFALNIIEEDEMPLYQAFYGCVQYRKNEKTGKEEPYIDTTPEGHYYAVVFDLKDKGINAVGKIADTANKASEIIKCPSPIYAEDMEIDGMQYSNRIPVWSEVKPNGERMGIYNLTEDMTFNVSLVECTKELYAKYLLKEDEEPLPCKIEEENGVKIAKYCDLSKMSGAEKPQAKKNTAAKKSAAKTTKAKTTGGKK